MSGEKPAAAVAGHAADPGKRIDHSIFGITGAPQDIDAVAIGCVLLRATVAAGYELAGDGRQRAGRGK
jgi:hypothetical protein